MVIFLEACRIFYLRRMKVKLEEGCEKIVERWNVLRDGHVQSPGTVLAYEIRLDSLLCTTDRICNQYRLFRDSTCPRTSGT